MRHPEEQTSSPDSQEEAHALSLPRRPRQRASAPKKKTGCLTCRKRRVKCDELKPQCTRCGILRLTCEYSILHTPSIHRPWQQSRDNSVSPTPTEGTGTHVTYRQPPRLAIPLNGIILEQDRECFQFRRYYSEVMHPSFGDMLDFGDIESVEMVEKSDPKYMKSKSKRLNWVPYGNASWFLDVTSYHISRLCDARNIGPQESSHLTTEWTAFYKYMAQSLESINYALSDPDLTPGDQAIVLMQIANVTSAGLRVIGTPWQVHLVGYFTLIQLLGEDTEWLHDSPTIGVTQYMMCNVVMANSTSPPDRQIEQIYQLDPQLIQAIYEHCLYGEMPCPTSLFFSIIHLTRLRIWKNNKTLNSSDILARTRDILDSVEDFSVDDWDEPYGAQGRPVLRAMALVFQTAVILYAMLSLSRSPAQDLKIYRLSRAEVCDRLILLMKEAILHLKSKMALCWPLSVVAVAVADGKPKGREFVENILMADPKGMENFYMPLAYMRKLRKFWMSGKTGWDECYNEPYPPLA